MHRLIALAVVAVLAGAGVLVATASGDGDGGGTRSAGVTASAAGKRQVLVGRMTKLNGTRVSLSRYRGRVVLVVNTASQCVNTPQFGPLEKLYLRKRGAGLTILGFPSGDFGDQEYSDPKQIDGFCRRNFGVSFPMFAKTHVTGAAANPLYKRLIGEAGPPNWNFGKYLVDRRGHVVRRFDAYTPPTDATIVRAIDRELHR